MKRKLAAGLTSATIPIFIQDTTSTTGAGLAVAFNASGLVAEYRRQGQSSWTAITLSSGTLGTWSSGGWSADTGLTGAYEVGIPDAALAAGARWVAIRFRGATNMLPVLVEIELDAVNYQSATAFITGVNSLAPPTNWNLESIDASGRVDLGKWLGSAPDALSSGKVPADLKLWLTAAPAALSTNGYVQAMLLRWLTDNAGGTPDALSSGKMPADLKLWLATAPLALSAQQVQSIVAAYASGQAPLQPTVAGRTLDVAATGEAGLDFDNIHDASGAHTLTNIRVPNVTLADTVTTYTGNTPQTGDVYPLVDTEIAAIKAKTDNLPASPAAVGSNMGTVSSVTGNVGGNVVGSVGSMADAGASLTSIGDARIEEILQLHGKNVGVRNQTYDTNNCLLTADICTYDTAAHALTNDGTTGLVHKYTINATWASATQQTQESTRKIS